MDTQLNEPIKAYVHSFESFGSVDGPGIRYVIFLTGCAMRCQYCHNPDTWQLMSGTQYTSEELLEKAIKYRPYWGSTGGITISGGEPLLQIDFLIDFCRKAKDKNIHVTIDTSGNPFSRNESFLQKFKELITYTDLFLLDIKHMDEKQHEILTGCSNKNILDMAKYLSDSGKKIWLRHVLVPGINDEDIYLKELYQFIQSLHNVEKVELLPYHTLGIAKWKDLGLKYELQVINPPKKEQIQNARQLLHIDQERF